MCVRLCEMHRRQQSAYSDMSSGGTKIPGVKSADGMDEFDAIASKRHLTAYGVNARCFSMAVTGAPGTTRAFRKRGAERCGKSW